MLRHRSSTLALRPCCVGLIACAAALVSLVLSSFISVIPAGARSARPDLSSSLHTFTSAGTSPVTGLSCTEQGECFAVDDDGQVDLLSGNDEAQLASTGYYLNAVSCAAANFCMAVGNGTAIEMLPTGVRTFALGQSSEPNTAYIDWRWLSCPASDFCMAGGYVLAGTQKDEPMDATWNGLVWSRVAAMTTRSSRPRAAVITSLSCTERTFCVAAGVQGSMLRWNGSGWSRSKLPVVNDIFMVSCVSTSFCLAVGKTTADVYRWDGQIWRGAPSPDLPGYGAEVSCASSIFCVATDAGLASVWHGRSWSSSLSLDPGHYFFGLSCAAGFCEATEAKDRYAYLYDPHKPPKLPAFPGTSLA
jgi:hypothetical protein